MLQTYHIPHINAPLHETFQIIAPSLAEHGIYLERATLPKHILYDFTEWDACIWRTSSGRGILRCRGSKIMYSIDPDHVIDLCCPNSIEKLINIIAMDLVF